MKKENPHLVIAREEAVAAAFREIALGVHSGRSLDRVFSILSLVLEMGPLEIALRALRTGQTPIRGTALEYLENVLPAAARKELWPHLGSPAPAVPSCRSQEEIRDDLLRSTAGSNARPRSGGPTVSADGARVRHEHALSHWLVGVSSSLRG